MRHSGATSSKRTKIRLTSGTPRRPRGALFVQNIEVLLYCYLIIKRGEDVKLETLFKEYKKWLAGMAPEARKAFLEELGVYADIYFSLPSGTDLNQIRFDESEKRFFHLVENLQVTTVYPLVLYIYKNVQGRDSPQQ